VAKTVLIDEFHVALYVPRGLADTECDVIRQTLDTSRFRSQFRHAVRVVLRRNQALAQVRLTITR
jgi:hypothetical protein